MKDGEEVVYQDVLGAQENRCGFIKTTCRGLYSKNYFRFPDEYLENN
nr:hypothetical protein [Bacteroidota bacterium]